MGPVLVLLLAAAGQVPIPEALDLEIGVVLDVEHRAEEPRLFRAELEGGQAYVLEVGQRELDVLVEITAPDGTSRTFDAPLLRFGPERLLIEPLASGLYQISVRSTEYKRDPARLELRLDPRGPLEGADQHGREALRFELRAAESNHAGNMDQWRQAADLYQAAAESWRSTGAYAEEARARLALAWLLYGNLSAWQESVQEAARATELYDRLDKPGALAAAMHVQAAGLLEQAEFAQAEALLNSAMRIREQRSERYERARVINELGVSAALQGKWLAARQSFEEAALRLHAEGEWAEEFKARSNLASVDQTLGNLKQALQGYERILELIRPGELQAWRGDLLDNMATAYRALGHLSEALASYSQALAVHEEHGSFKGRGRSLSGLGVTYYGFGDLDLARDYLERALEVRRDARDGPGQVSTLLFLGGVYLEQGDADRAIQAHGAAIELAASPRERARAQVMLSRDLAAAGQIVEALAMLETAHATGVEAGTPIVAADALLEQGRLLLEARRIDEAEAPLQQALQHYRALSWTSGEAQALHQLGRVAYRRGELDQALKHAAGAIDRTEKLRNLIVNPELRASFLATQRDPYSLYIAIALDLADRASGSVRDSWLARALETSERARMRAMLELIEDTASGRLHAGDAALEAQRSTLYATLAGLRARQSRLLERGRDAATLVEVSAALSRVETELQVLESEIRRKDPRQASLTAPATLDARQIQAALDEEVTLLQYELGEERSWLFAVNHDSISAHPLPARSEIEALARRAHRLLQHANPDRGLRAERDSTLASLSSMLVEPARPLRDTLVLALDGALHLLPFAALPDLRTSGENKPLVAAYDLVNVPSVSVLVAQRELRAARQHPVRTVAVFADPVFTADDSRFLAQPQVNEVRTEPDARVPNMPGSLDALPRLPGTAKEAEAIAALVPAEQRVVLMGFDATRAAVLDTKLDEFRILHFATHALVDDRYPALSALAFTSLGADRSPLDGLLRLHEVYNLSLAADLVVLSACETALGRELRGEGLLSLTRGFLHAGSDSVVASLWRAPDRATAELMGDFHEAVLLEGLTPAVALSRAQLARYETRGFGNPYYWASFVAHGEWRSMAASRHALEADR
jgi:CHAT domain-containing protein